MATSSNGYEIRLTILQMAKDMVYEGWHAQQHAARHNAQLAQAPVTAPLPPSFGEIEDLAQKLYGFVRERGAPSSTHKTGWTKTPWQGAEPDSGAAALRNPAIPPSTK